MSKISSFFELLDNITEKEMKVVSANNGQTMTFNLKKVESYDVVEDGNQYEVTHTLDYNDGTEITDQYLVARKPFQVNDTTQYLIVFGYNHLVENTFKQCEHQEVKEFLAQAIVEIVGADSTLGMKKSFEDLEMEQIVMEGKKFTISKSPEGSERQIDLFNPETNELSRYTEYLNVIVLDGDVEYDYAWVITENNELAYVDVLKKTFIDEETTKDLYAATHYALLKINDML